MPIKFQVIESGEFLAVSFLGVITDRELLEAYQHFYADGKQRPGVNDRWRPGLNEFIDVSQGEFSQLTAEGLRGLMEYTRLVLEKNGVTEMVSAVYAPDDLPFGLSRMYEAYCLDSPESIQVFRDSSEALAWLNQFAQSDT